MFFPISMALDTWKWSAELKQATVDQSITWGSNPFSTSREVSEKAGSTYSSSAL